MAHDPQPPARPAPPDRPAWKTPALTEYGPIGKLTQGSGGTNPESGGRMLGCL